MAAETISVSSFVFTVNYPVVDLFKPLEKIYRPRGRIFEIFWVKVQKFKKPLRELRAKNQKSVFVVPSNFTCLSLRQTLATYVEEQNVHNFLRRHQRKCQKTDFLPKWRPNRFQFPVLTLQVYTPWPTCSNPLKKLVGPNGEFLRYFELKFKNSKKH